MKRFVFIILFVLAAMSLSANAAIIDDGLFVNYGGINTTVTLTDPSTEYLDVGPFIDPSPPNPTILTGYLTILGPVTGVDESPDAVSDYLVCHTGSSLQLYSDEYANWPPDFSGLTQLGNIHETGDWQSVGNYFGLNTDQIKIISDVPEPATIAMLSLGGLALLRRKR